MVAVPDLGWMQEPGLLGALLRAVAVGQGHACLYCESSGAGAVLLDRAQAALPLAGIRVVRVGTRGPGAFDLPELVRQVEQQWPRALGGEDRLERAFLTLTVPGSSHGQVALLIEGAERLAPVAVRYLKLTCQSGPALRIVLAGDADGLKRWLEAPECRWVGDRLACALDVPAAGAQPVRVNRRHLARRRAGIGLALAASVLVAAWTAWRGAGPWLPTAQVAETPASVALAGPSAEPALVLRPAAPTPVPDTPSVPSPASAPVLLAEAAPEQVFPAETEPALIPETEAAALVLRVDAAMDEGGPVPAAASAPVALETADSGAEPAIKPMPAMAYVPPAPLTLARFAPADVVPQAARTVLASVLVRPELRAGPSPPALGAHLRPERGGQFAAQHCRAIVVRAQLGEDPSDADRDFLRRGCPVER